MDNVKNILKIVIIAALMYITAVSIIQRVKRPDLTEGQLFLLLPDNITLNFK